MGLTLTSLGRRTACRLVLIVATGISCCGAQAQGLQLESAGVRFGLSPASDDHKFHQAEVTANWNLPWAWSLGSRWRLESRIDASAGWLGDPGGDAAIGTVGPSLVLRLEGFPVTLEGGVSPTLLSRQEFATKNLGSYFQFTSHAGLNWDFAPRWRLGYRFQHMSNAGIGSPNPGLNLHMIGVSYLF